MTPADVPHEPTTFALWREAQDTRVRTRLGGAFYLLAWLLTWGASTAPLTAWLPGMVGSVFFAGMFAARLRHRLPETTSVTTLQRWLNHHWVLIFVTAFSWGLAHAWSLSTTAYADTWIIATLSTVAFSTAIAFNFAMRRARAVIALALLYLPGLMALISQGAGQQAMLVTLLFYLAYLVLALNRSHQEYRATLALELKFLEQQAVLEQLSRTDSMTQLGNRYQFNSLFPVLAASAVRQGSALSLLLIDIDLFKRINDQYGHTAGDTCLSLFAARMREVFRRDTDTLLRLGGEEFGVLMPDTELEQAQCMAEQLLQALREQPFEIADTSLQLTASIGAGCYNPATDASTEAFFTRVDAALYRAKDEGRDRLVLA